MSELVVTLEGEPLTDAEFLAMQQRFMADLELVRSKMAELSKVIETIDKKTYDFLGVSDLLDYLWEKCHNIEEYQKDLL